MSNDFSVFFGIYRLHEWVMLIVIFETLNFLSTNMTSEVIDSGTDPGVAINADADARSVYVSCKFIFANTLGRPNMCSFFGLPCTEIGFS